MPPPDDQPAWLRISVAWVALAGTREQRVQLELARARLEHDPAWQEYLRASVVGVGTEAGHHYLEICDEERPRLAFRPGSRAVLQRVPVSRLQAADEAGRLHDELVDILRTFYVKWSSGVDGAPEPPPARYDLPLPDGVAEDIRARDDAREREQDEMDAWIAQLEEESGMPGAFGTRMPRA